MQRHSAASITPENGHAHLAEALSTSVLVPSAAKLTAANVYSYVLGWLSDHTPVYYWAFVTLPSAPVRAHCFVKSKKQ